MDGWTVAFILYMIPVLVAILPLKSVDEHHPEFWVALLWPILSLVGAVVMWFQMRKR